MAKSTPKVRFFCFHCYEPVSAPVEHIGRKGQCPRCGKLTRIPPTSTRGPNRAAIAQSAQRQTNEFVAAAENEGSAIAPAHATVEAQAGTPDQSAAPPRTAAPVETGALPAVTASSLDDSAVSPSAGNNGTDRGSSNGAPATGPAAPRPVVDHQKIEVWKEVFRGKPAGNNGKAPVAKPK